jgi:hypothetical protein
LAPGLFGTVGAGILNNTAPAEGRQKGRAARFIPTRVHGLHDYSVGTLLVLAPWLLGFVRQGAETWVPVILGAGAVVYSLLTDYEWGAVRAVPMPAHLALDFGNGVLLASSPLAVRLLPRGLGATSPWGCSRWGRPCSHRTGPPRLPSEVNRRAGTPGA